MGNQLNTSKAIWATIKWVAFLVVLVFVAWHGWTLWNKFETGPTHLNWGWLTLATAVSIVAWFPSVWFWRRIMVQLGAPAPWPQVTRAYYCGGLGKYLPGKAAVIVIRAALLKPVGVPATTAGLAVTHESLTFMWIGGLWVILLYPALAPHLPAWIATHGDQPLLRFGVLAGDVLACSCGLVMLVRSHRILRGVFGAKRATAAQDNPGSRSNAEIGLIAADDHSPQQIRNDIHASGSDRSVGPPAAGEAGPVHLSFGEALRMTLTGGAVFLADWWIHGLTLGLTIFGVIGDRAEWSDWPFWTGAAAVALVGGFLVLLAPGGLGVREGLLLELLERQLGPREAVLVTVLWRGVALAGEIAAAGALYYGIKGTPVVEKNTRVETAEEPRGFPTLSAK
jgi:hypothetical protein